jgi:hypothetical protein
MGILGQAAIHYIIGLCLWAPPREHRNPNGLSSPPRWGRLFLGVRGAGIAYRTICLRAQSALQSRMAAARRQKITLAEMRASGVHGLLIYCSDYHCSHWTAISGDRWGDDVRLSDLEAAFYLSGLRPAWCGCETRFRKASQRQHETNSANFFQQYRRGIIRRGKV